MAGVTKFDVEVYVKGQEILPEMAGRLSDMSPAFDAIINEWAKLNVQKFLKSKGQERVGAQLDEGVFWEPLAESTISKKKSEGRADWIMVDTGSLMKSMMDPDLVHRAVTSQDAAFGAPTDPDDLKKVQYNWFKRQAIFLSVQDQNSIRRIVQDYISLGPEFASIRMARGAAMQAQRQNIARMNQEFNVGDGGGDW